MLFFKIVGEGLVGGIGRVVGWSYHLPLLELSPTKRNVIYFQSTKNGLVGGNANKGEKYKCHAHENN